MIPAGVDRGAAPIRLVARWWLPSDIDRDAVAACAVAAARRGRSRWATVIRELIGLIALGFRLRCRRATDDRPAPIVVQGLIAGGAGVGVLVAAGSIGAPAGALVAVGVVAPAMLLAAGWFDPRLAVAATVVWGWRFAVANHDAVLGDLGRLGWGITVTELIVRWVMMAAGVLVALVVARTSIRRAALV